MRGSPGSRAVARVPWEVLALTIGLTKVQVLLNGVVPSAFPPAVTRSAVAGAMWVGAAAAAASLPVLVGLGEWQQEGRRPPRAGAGQGD